MGDTENNNEMSTTKADSYLNMELAWDFRTAINASPIFCKDVGCKPHYNLICAVMDRVETCVAYLNKHSNYPQTEEEFLQFMMFACMLTDAVKQILADIGADKGPDNGNAEGEPTSYFKDICMGAPLNIPEKDCPTDDKFWEYFRSVTFAHPFETSRPKFFQKGEIQYSPWVIVHTRGPIHRNTSEPIGVRIYSSVRTQIMDLVLPFSTIKNYIKSEYEHIVVATEWAKKQIETFEERWRQEKINRDQTPEDLALNIKQVLEGRFVESYDLDLAYQYLTCKLTNPKNATSVRIFRDAISSILPALCDAVEALDYDLMWDLVHSVICVLPQRMHNMANYQLEKIFCYLRRDISSENVYWGLIQAKAFADEFAAKWVTIDVDTMSFEEIQLLVQTACYLEAMEQAGNIIDPYPYPYHGKTGQHPLI